MVFPRVAILLAMWAPCSCFMVNQPVAPCPSIGGGALTSGAALFGAVLPSASRRCSELLMQKGNKPKKDMLELEGEVQEALPNAMFRVKLDDTEQVRPIRPTPPPTPPPHTTVHATVHANHPPQHSNQRPHTDAHTPHRSSSASSQARSVRTLSRFSWAIT